MLLIYTFPVTFNTKDTISWVTEKDCDTLRPPYNKSNNHNSTSGIITWISCRLSEQHERPEKYFFLDKMASQSAGIQQLLAAEKKAAEKVAEARKRKFLILF